MHRLTHLFLKRVLNTNPESTRQGNAKRSFSCAACGRGTQCRQPGLLAPKTKGHKTANYITVKETNCSEHIPGYFPD